MKKHKWADEIIYWANGGEVESKFLYQKTWYINDTPDWNNEEFEYRIKPQPKESRIIREMKEAMEDLQKSLGREPQLKEPQYLYVYDDIVFGMCGLEKEILVDDEDGRFKYIGKIKLEVDE